nr:Holliday junction resolvase RecU [Metamycoplasma hominis]
MKNKNNRGMLLESIINNTNEYYFKNGIALIHKKIWILNLKMLN